MSITATSVSSATTVTGFSFDASNAVDTTLYLHRHCKHIHGDHRWLVWWKEVRLGSSYFQYWTKISLSYKVIHFLHKLQHFLMIHFSLFFADAQLIQEIKRRHTHQRLYRPIHVYNYVFAVLISDIFEFHPLAPGDSM